MPRVTFERDFTWAPSRGVRLRYRAGCTYPVTSRCLAEAQAAGAVTVPLGWPTRIAPVLDPEEGGGAER